MASPVTREKRNDWILPPWSLTFDFEPLIGVWHFRQRGATFSINRLGNKLGNKSRRYFMSEIWQIMTLFCIMPVHTGDQRSPLSDIARLTRQPALKSWGLILNWKSRNLEVFQKYTSWPGYDCASSSKKEVPWIGISWVSQVQLPWGKLPGSGQVFPEYLLSFVENITKHYLWGSWTTNIFFCDFYSCLCRLGDNSRLHCSRHCTCLCTIWSSFDL